MVAFAATSAARPRSPAQREDLLREAAVYDGLRDRCPATAAPSAFFGVPFTPVVRVSAGSGLTPIADEQRDTRTTITLADLTMTALVFFLAMQKRIVNGLQGAVKG